MLIMNFDQIDRTEANAEDSFFPFYHTDRLYTIL